MRLAKQLSLGFGNYCPGRSGPGAVLAEVEFAGTLNPKPLTVPESSAVLQLVPNMRLV